MRGRSVVHDSEDQVCRRKIKSAGGVVSTGSRWAPSSTMFILELGNESRGAAGLILPRTRESSVGTRELCWMPLPWDTGLAALLSYTLSRKAPSLRGDPSSLPVAAGDRIAVAF